MIEADAESLLVIGSTILSTMVLFIIDVNDSLSFSLSASCIVSSIKTL